VVVEAMVRMFSWPSLGFCGLLWAGLGLMLTGCSAGVRRVVGIGCGSGLRRIVMVYYGLRKRKVRRGPLEKR